MNEDTRLKEWFVPKFGPLKFRIFIGLLFLPYTGMCVSFTVFGSLIATRVLWERVGAIALIYGLALGISAHALDSIGSKQIKPWGYYYSKQFLWLLAISSLLVAYSIGIYYMILYVPLLWLIAILEGFFIFAYNFELFKGYFHNDFWFSISWGVLPVLSGYIMQTNSITLIPLVAAAITGTLSYSEIKISRSYKELKRSGQNDNLSKQIEAKRLERYLKIISLGTIVFVVAICVYRSALIS